MTTYYENGEIHGQDKPFQVTHGKTEKDSVDIRLNVEERAQLDKFMDLTNIPFEGTAYKIALDIALNVLHNTLGSANLQYLFSQKRRRRN